MQRVFMSMLALALGSVPVAGKDSGRAEAGTHQADNRKKDSAGKRESSVNQVRRMLQKEAVILRSSAAPLELNGDVSCLGCVTRRLPGEEWPTDVEGNRLEPLATIFVPDLPGVPEALSKVALITIFAPLEAWAEDPKEKTKLGCVIRTYSDLIGVESCHYVSETLKPCILTPEAVADDMPKGPSCGGGRKVWKQVEVLEKKHKLDYLRDVCSADYETHKLGGYPTYVQGKPDIPKRYPFVLQISHDDAAGLEVADGGSYYFFYNPDKKDWRVYADFY